MSKPNARETMYSSSGRNRSGSPKLVAVNRSHPATRVRSERAISRGFTADILRAIRVESARQSRVGAEREHRTSAEAPHMNVPNAESDQGDRGSDQNFGQLVSAAARSERH